MVRTALVIYLIATLVPALLVPLVFFLTGQDNAGAALGLITPALMFVPLIASILAHALASRRHFTLLELWRVGRPRRLDLYGVLAAVAVIALVGLVQMAVALAAGWVDWAPVEGAVTTTALVPVLLVLACVTTFGEETGWRGYAQSLLTPRIGLWATAVAIAVYWAIWHIPAYVVYLSAGTATPREFIATMGNLVVSGIVLSVLVDRFDSIWPAVVGHAAMNTVLVYLSGTLLGGLSQIGAVGFWGFTVAGWALWVVAAGVVARMRGGSAVLSG